MNVNSAHMGVQALGALMSLGGDEDIRNTIVAAGGYPLILEAMRQHASKVLQMRACGALWALAASLMDAGATPLVLNSIRNHPTEPGLIECAGGALRSRAGSRDARADALAQIANRGGVQLLHKAIQDNAKRQRYTRRHPNAGRRCLAHAELRYASVTHEEEVLVEEKEKEKMRERRARERAREQGERERQRKGE